MSDSPEKPRINPWSIWMIIAIMLGGILVTFNYRKRNQYEAESPRPPYLTKLEKDLMTMDQSGDITLLSEMRGKVWVGSYLFTDCPAGCLGVAAELKDLYSEFEPNDELYFISFSVNPEDDTPEKMTDWLENQGVAHDDWWFLTEPPAEEKQGAPILKYMTGEVRLNAPRPVGDPVEAEKYGIYEHDLRIFLVDGKANVRGYYDLFHPEEFFRQQNYERLRKDLQYLLDEAAEEEEEGEEGPKEETS